jgi:DNA polymerase-1
MVDAFAVKSARDASEYGYIETLFGRRRSMDDFRANDPKARARGRRLSVNLQIQGGAADIAKIGLLRQDRARKRFDGEKGCTTYLCNFIHDSYLWEVPSVSEDSQEQERFVQEFVEAMKEALCFDVAKLTGIDEFPDLKVDFKTGANYHSMAALRSVTNKGRYGHKQRVDDVPNDEKGR